MQDCCPICNAKEFKPLFYVSDYLVSHEKFQITQCTNCGMHITQNPPKADKIQRYYESDEYVSHSNSKKGVVNWLYHRVREFMLSRKAHWVTTNAGINRGRLLDVGAGTGYFADAMKKRTWQVSVVEQSDEARQFSEKNFKLKAFNSIEHCIESEKDSINKFDVITLWHVLEHLPDPNKALQQFDSLLIHDGLLTIAVPNCESYDAKKYRQNWAAYDVPRHLWHFQYKHMEMLAQNNGFYIANTKAMPFDAFYIAMLSEKQMKHSRAFLKGITTGLKAYTHSIFNKKQSSSLVYFLKKK